MLSVSTLRPRRYRKNYHHGNLAEAILLRAAEIIDERGIEALSLRSVARDLNVSHSAPNRHFKSKTDLLSALALDGWLKVRDATPFGGRGNWQQQSPYSA